MMSASRSATIHTLWVGGRLGRVQWLCLSSWVQLGYKVVLHAYEKLPVPAGVEIYDASQLWPANKIFRSPRNGSLALFADVYRLLILQNFDALWLDTDIYLVREFDFSAPNILAREDGNDIKHINAAVLKLRPDHPLLVELLGIFKNPYRALPWDKPGKLWQTFVQSGAGLFLHGKHLPWGTLGFKSIQKHVARHGFDGLILGSDLCLTASRTSLFTKTDDPDAMLAEPVTYIHFYTSNLKDKADNAIAGSVYARLEERTPMAGGWAN